MRFFGFLVVALLLLSACKEKPDAAQNQASEAEATPVAAVAQGRVFGQTPSSTESLQAVEVLQAYGDLAAGDTLRTAFRAEVLEVCQAKGCWMRLSLPGEAGGEAVMVRFKDYGFFVPKDIAGQQVLVEGLAFISEVTEEDRRHLASDAGASKEAIAAITGSSREFGFEASGVLIPAGQE